ncbi:MAG: hypothetical protein JW874_03580 [Spirochaetales bacterium]|nr:hypothetical protein [Spirochaetales bacterium]
MNSLQNRKKIYPVMHALVLPVFFLLPGLMSCELFPYGLWGDKGVLSVTIIDETGPYISISSVYVELNKSYTDSDGTGREEDFPGDADEFEIVLPDLEPGDWQMKIEIYNDNNDPGEIRNLPVHIYKSSETSFECTVRYNRAEGRFALSLEDTSEEFPDSGTNNIDFMGYCSNALTGVAMHAAINTETVYSGLFYVPVTEDSWDSLPFAAQPDPLFSAAEGLLVEDSVLCITDMSYPVDLMDNLFGVALFDEESLQLLFYEEIPTINNSAVLSAVYYSGMQGDSVDVSLTSTDGSDLAVGIIENEDGIIQAETRISGGYVEWLFINTSYVDAGDAVVWIILYDLESDWDTENGAVGTFLDLTDFDPYIDPVRNAYVRIRNIQVFQTNITISQQ